MIHVSLNIVILFQQLANKAAFKLRTQALQKTRDNKVTRSHHED